MLNLLILMVAFLVPQALPVHAATPVSSVTMASDISVAMCKKMAACKELGEQTVDGCVKDLISGLDSNNSREHTPTVTASELKACTKAIARGPCGHYAEPPQACKFMKEM